MSHVEFDFVKNLHETHEMMIKHTHIQFRSNLLNIQCVVLQYADRKVYCVLTGSTLPKFCFFVIC